MKPLDTNADTPLTNSKALKATVDGGMLRYELVKAEDCREIERKLNGANGALQIVSKRLASNETELRKWKEAYKRLEDMLADPLFSSEPGESDDV